MGMDLYSGGHFSHDLGTKKLPVSTTSRYFQSIFYKLKEDHNIDYDQMEKDFKENNAQLLIAGASAYPGDFDYKRMRAIADSNSAFLYADISHISTIIACGKMNSPFEYCDIAMTTMQKMLRGPKSAIIMYRKRKNGLNIEELIEQSVSRFQCVQHYELIAGIAAAFRLALESEYKMFVDQVLSNMQAMVHVFLKCGLRLMTGGTVNHLVMIDMHNIELDSGRISINASLFE